MSVDLELFFLKILFFAYAVFDITSGNNESPAIEYIAYLSENGLHGTIKFEEYLANSELKIFTNLQPTLQFPTQSWSWSINEFPVDYTNIEGRCHKLGKSLLRLDETQGTLFIPENGTSEYTVESNMRVFGKSIVLQNNYGQICCASILLTSSNVDKVAIASFHSPVAGNVYFHWFATRNNEKDMLITSDLFLVHNVEKINRTLVPYTEHRWKLYATDILDSDEESNDINCNILQSVFDPDARGLGKGLGDIDDRVGKVKISSDYNKRQYKTTFRDDTLELLPGDISGPQRKLFLVIFENAHPDSFLACAKIRYDHPTTAKVVLQSSGIKGEIRLSQRNRYEPTFLRFNLTAARGDLETKIIYASSVAGYKIHELPMVPSRKLEQVENSCLTTKNVFNPRNVENPPPNGFGTQDQYSVGDLSGKLLNRNNNTLIIPSGSNELSGNYWDVNLSLMGKHSVIYRSLVIYKNTKYYEDVIAEPWICGLITPYSNNFKQEKPIATAEVIFRYPLVGRILFRQVRDEPWTDTSIFVEYLVHADGSAVNNSGDHRWAVHENPPGKDFYNWTARCLSAGSIFNPFKVDFDNRTVMDECNDKVAGVCRLGDLSNRQGTLRIAGHKVDSDKVSRRLLTDSNLPLSGRTNILGKSFVIYDDFGPVARGERLACSIISNVPRRKAVVRDWFPNGEALSIKGRLEFIQQSEYDITNVDVDLEGLHDAGGYQIHIAPIEENLEFPCESSSLYDHWNPLNVDPQSSPKYYQGTPDQYEMGDLSGKHGSLENRTIYQETFNDTMLPLFGPRSVLGRSVVIHKRQGGQRWACATIERGYSPSEARELRAIASFHNPAGFAYGYMRMSQLIHSDGSMSETIIEAKLRHPGKHDRNVTRDHNWAVFVNPVGVDATVATTATRCVAGGYVWNPYYTQLADPLNEELYNKECGPENPLRCYVGDMSSRLGTIDIGDKRKVFTDSNLPLEGLVNAMGRSIVIMGPNKRSEKFACANIEPDHDIIKFANIEKPPRFVIAQFVEDLRDVLGVPPWMLTVDTRSTKLLHSNACVQLLFHMKGPVAKQLELDFSKLLATGRLESPTLYIPGYYNAKRKQKISYKLCDVKDPNEKRKKQRKSSFSILGLGNNVAQANTVGGIFNIFGLILLTNCYCLIRIS